MARKKSVLRQRLVGILLMLGAIICEGCMNVGFDRVARDRFGYTDAISESWKRQMLLNMVKLRYADTPVFLEVASVISQYGLETEVQGRLGWDEVLPGGNQSVSARSRYVDRPTITYQPLIGQKFTRSMMTPIPPVAVMSLVEGGWRSDFVFRICVQSINGIYNRASRGQEPEPADPNFYVLTDRLLRIQQARAVGMRVENADAPASPIVLFFRENNINADTAAAIGQFKKMLGLDTGVSEFSIVYGALPADNREIAILSRSMITNLGELASYVNAPPSDVNEGRVTADFAAASDLAAGLVPLMSVKCSDSEPQDAFAAVRYRDRWFWIDDRDWQSKRMFSLIMFIFTLADTTTPQQGPVIMVPTG